MREMTHLPPARRVIRLFPDYGRDWPLWEDSTSTWDIGYTTDPETYSLSAGLSRDIADWNALWVRNFDPFDGWASDLLRTKWEAVGLDIAARLRNEVAAFADVSYEPWPLQM
ncbi:hypothetical protein FM113_00850 [Leucobacter sp. 7(1)]|nr:hypothetical protein FM113_00850 [Leucobacter sp. 7(1)]